MKISVLDAATLGEDIDLSPLYKLGDVTVHPITAQSQIIDHAADADVLVLNKLKLNDSNLPYLKNLRLVCVTATGYDNVDTECCKRLGIALCNVPGYSTDSVVSLTIAMVMSLATHLDEYRAFVHSGDYSRSGVANRLVPVWHELCGLTWGVVGGGAIGGGVAKVANAMGCNVIVCRRTTDPVFETVDIDTLCKRADIITLHVPLTDETRGMINRERISLMKDTAILVNVARGAVTDEAALADAVKNKSLGALGVDVYSTEPFDSTHPFSEILDLPNVCLTPHMAWGALEARNRCIEVIADSILAFYKNESRNRVV